MDPNAFIRELIGDDADPEMHRSLAAVLGALQLCGLTPDQGCDFVLAFDTSLSTAGERGIDPRTLVPIPGATDIMRTVALRLAALVAVMDSNQSALALAYNTKAHPCRPITPRNHRSWYDDNVPSPDGRTNLGAALEAILAMIGEEQGIPALGELAAAAHKHKVRRDTPSDLLPKIRLFTPVNAIMTVEGDVSDAATAERILSVTRNIDALRWTIIFASRETIGRPTLENFQRCNPNVRLCLLPDGVEGTSRPFFYVSLLEGMKGWLERGLNLLSPRVTAA